MKIEKWMIWSLPAFALLLNACLRDVGECYVPNDDGQGGQGGTIVPGGAGGYGDVPRRPLDASGPVGDPCSTQTAECTVTWKPGSDVCKQQGTASACITVYQGSHATLTEAKEQCEKSSGVGTDKGAQSCGPCQWVQGSKGDPVEQCKKLCDKINEDCIARCPKGDKGCMNDCNQKNGECLKECEK
jgi:hypothetical protein